MEKDIDSAGSSLYEHYLMETSGMAAKERVGMIQAELDYWSKNYAKSLWFN